MRSTRWTLAGLAVVALAAVAVAVLAGVLARRIADPEAPEPVAVRLIEAGDARFTVPDAWAPATARSTGIAGLDASRLVVLDPSPGLAARVVAVFGPADHPSLIPAALRARLRSPPGQPSGTSLGGRPAWTYRALATRGSDVELDVTVLPTTAGVLALACTAPADEFTASDCGTGVRSVAVRGGATLQPSPAIALADRLPVVLARLDRERAEARTALARARTRPRQAAIARDLARQHVAAARSLRLAGGPAARSVVTGLERGGLAYAQLGSAADDGSAARFAAARSAIRNAESNLTGAIDDVLAEAGRRTSPAPPPPPPVPTVDDTPRRVPGALVLVLVVVLISAALGFALSGPSATAAAAVLRAVRRTAR